MATTTENSIDATISRVLFHQISKYDPAGVPFAILKLSTGVVAKGQMREPVVGSSYRFFGALAPQKGGYPDAFEFHSHEALCDQSVDGVVDYLNAHVKKIGRVKAKALVAAFGDETLTVLRTDPERALEVEGINESIVESIKTHFADNRKFDPVAYSKLIDMFKDHRISKKVIELLLKAFGSDAPNKVLKNPYLLLMYPRVGWKTADSFALSQPPKGAGYDPHGSDRHESAVLEAMEQIASDGHTSATQAEVLRTAEKLLGETLVDGTLEKLVAKRDLVEGDNGSGVIYQIASLADAEETIAEKLRELAAAGRPLPKVVTKEWTEATGLGDDQVRAATLIEENAVCIITGAPGVGKSYVISRIVKAMQAAGVVGIRCACPTGKASKRLAELLLSAGVSDVPSTTIHKALKPAPSAAPEGVPADDARFGRGREPFGFGHNESNPLEDRVVIIDETSMVDVKLLASLLRAIKPGTRVIFVGDHNQLPSVGPGSTLRDMIAAGIPTAELTQIRRSDGGGTIVKACHAIKDGVVPRDADRINLPTDNWIHIEIEDPNQIAAKIVELHATTKKFDPMWDMQVVSPQKAKLPIGCENLNRLLSRQINPTAHYVDDQAGEIEPQFKVGDKVVRTKNEAVDEMILWEDRRKYSRSNPEIMEKSRPDMEWRGQKYVAITTAIVNGDMGSVEDIIEGSSPSVIVRFRDPERLVRLPYGEANLLMAYALTCHKMQGSGASYVIIPVSNSFFYDSKTGKGLWTRELFYTMISRAEQLLITVGKWDSIPTAIGRKTVERRQTTLEQRITGIYQEKTPPEPEPPSTEPSPPEAPQGHPEPPEPPKDEVRSDEPPSPSDANGHTEDLYAPSLPASFWPSLLEATEAMDAPPAPTWPERSAAMQSMSGWNLERREAWGRKANELEERGVRFPENERVAYEEMILVDSTHPGGRKGWNLVTSRPLTPDQERAADELVRIELRAKDEKTSKRKRGDTRGSRNS